MKEFLKSRAPPAGIKGGKIAGSNANDGGDGGKQVTDSESANTRQQINEAGDHADDQQSMGGGPAQIARGRFESSHSEGLALNHSQNALPMDQSSRPSQDSQGYHSRLKSQLGANQRQRSGD